MDTKTCSTCLERRPIADFRLRRKHGTARRPECRQCRAMRERLRYAANQASNREKTLKRFWQSLADVRQRHRTAALVEGLVAKFGGLDCLIDAWHRAVTSDKASHQTVFQGLSSVIRLAEVYQER
jgi:hypothetical protein